MKLLMGRRQLVSHQLITFDFSAFHSPNCYARFSCILHGILFSPHTNYMQVYPEGTHLMIPWFERPIIYDVRARPHLVDSTSASRNPLCTILSTN